jgi:diguanylate cyclase (GGDEF)-like protein/PAS domain S-box-containing protein
MDSYEWSKAQQPTPQGETTAPERLIGTVVDRLFVPVVILDPNGTLLYANSAAAGAIGQQPIWIVGLNMLELIHPDDRERIRGQLQNIATSGPAGGLTRYRLRGDSTQEWRVFDSVADNLIDDEVIGGILVTSRDVTEQVTNERKLWDAAFLDELTGLPNRTKFTEALATMMSSDAEFSIAIIGIDRFSLINDSLGHSQGDKVLQIVAHRARAAAPKTTVVGRFAGDLFALLVREATVEECCALAMRVLDSIGQPMFIAGRDLQISASAGVAGKDAARTIESLLSEADLALHHAFAKGGGLVEQCASHMHAAAVARFELEANLRFALDHDELSLALQPIVNLKTSDATCAEALVRWHRYGTTIDPREFIPIAEETGLVVRLADWTLDRAAQLVPHAPGGAVLVNLSARNLAAPGLLERITHVIKQRQIPAYTLGFEVSESLLVENFDYAVKVVRAIKDLGCRVGLDDFGTGYSSFSYLRRLPIDFLKIDRSLITGIDRDTQARQIVVAILAMADALGLETIGEGVETTTELNLLRTLGCDFAQGFIFGKPFEPQ